MSTPVQRQFSELKKQNPDAILFFRLGDFYEMFFEDAQLASRVLGITLTARHKNSENEMPMCGIPHHAHREYLETLVSQGYKVAIAEQFESDDGKITRRIARVVTPGTSMESGALEPEKNAFLVAIGRDKKNYALAVADLSTGDFRTSEFATELDFLDEIWKLDPREILIPSDIFADEKFCKKLPRSLHTPRKNVGTKSAGELLKTHFGVTDLGTFGIEKITLLIEVSGQILAYLQETQKTDLSHVQKLVRYSTREILPLDAQTLRHLEIFEPLVRDETGSTLWSVFEKTRTAPGGRLLRGWIANPLLDAEKISARHDAIDTLFQNTEIAEKLRDNFKNICDLPRVLARISVGRGNARDLNFIRRSLEVFPEITNQIQNLDAPFFSEKISALENFEKLSENLKILIDEPPLEITSGGMFRDGISPELDEFRNLKKNADAWLANFLSTKKKETGISTLRLKFSKNFGFCLEVSIGAISKVPESWARRQTLVNAERFTTPELAEYEEKVLSAESRTFELEHRMFLELREKVLIHTSNLQRAAESLAAIDVIGTLAVTAQRWRWTRPQISQNSDIFSVVDGRHPVVEKLSLEPFISNDLRMDAASRFHLITGPNMSGKSTFLRQNALMILLAQAGSFVPARECRMGIFDRIFTRVGASDNLAAGKSTFFVEMLEAAHILNSATEKSFVILDEIGRGTSTFDGISIAWAITEFLHEKIRAKTIFATHYHELIDCVENLSGGKNSHVSVAQSSDGLVFLRKITPGGISDSFGIEVAKSTGFPREVIQKAREILTRLENENLAPTQPSLFGAKVVREKIIQIEKKSLLEEKLSAIDPNSLAPREALDLIFELKKNISESI
ncbi:DNA mismatch repair protein MutS [bacterium]|jgi:DNA mismatch repair protein MutS|nr:DNA mismatch repair protein MutS [bacterium]MBT6831856.1 DNA mismatch repair protein MutS [bacterium]MBT6996245.1 DNA mismatch repair protein MutS [bacterium]MBT7772588.1 DNA mismatch repair protein MutS [bacterium]